MDVEWADPCALDSAGLERTCLYGDSYIEASLSIIVSDGELPSTCACACACACALSSFRLAKHSFLVFSSWRASNASHQ
jgi:hypothetical protein